MSDWLGQFPSSICNGVLPSCWHMILFYEVLCSLLLPHVYFCTMTLIICRPRDDSLEYISDHVNPLHLLRCSALLVPFASVHDQMSCLTWPCFAPDPLLLISRSQFCLRDEEFQFPALQGLNDWTFWICFSSFVVGGVRFRGISLCEPICVCITSRFTFQIYDIKPCASSRKLHPFIGIIQGIHVTIKSLYATSSV